MIDKPVEIEFMTYEIKDLATYSKIACDYYRKNKEYRKEKEAREYYFHLLKIYGKNVKPKNDVYTIQIVGQRPVYGEGKDIKIFANGRMFNMSEIVKIIKEKDDE